ncbi:conserved repeat protein [Clostridium sp. CAG:465]|nr:conserved repeat protein [Clostridium sp. CAG:465]
MKNKTKYLVVTLFMLVSFLLIGATNVSAKTITVENEEELINASKGIDSEINEIKLAKDITLTKFLNFYVVNDITLELNGQTLDIGSYGLSFNYGQSDYDATSNDYYYNFNSKLTIKDSSSSKTGKILSKNNIFFNYYDTNHDAEIKKFGLTIDGGYYEIISSRPNFFEFFSRDYYTNGKNLTVDVNIKDAVFKLNDGMYLFGTISNSDSDIKLNFNFESLKVLGLTSKLGNLKLGEMKLNDVIDPNSKAYFQKLPYTTGAPVLAEADRNTLVDDFYASGGENPYIVIKKVNGFETNNITINETYNETPSLNDISIKNISDNDLQIKNVTVDSSNFKVEGPSTQPTVSAGATNTDFKIKAKEGLNAGDYTAIITVTDINGNNYTATVALKVEKKNLNVGISGLDSTWVYGTSKTPTATGVDGLGAGDYKITYYKENNGSYDEVVTELPKLVGKYKATLSITNQNYTASEASVNFEITPITTEVKVKSYDDTFTYDGTEHSKNAYDVLWANNASPVTDNKLPNGDLVTAVITGKVRDVKDTALENNTIGKITITNAEGVDVTNCYSNKVKAAGKLTVNPITTPIVVTAGSDTKVYDGAELTKNTYTNTDGVLLPGDMLEATITGSQKFVGSSNNTVSNVKVMRNGEDITSNYTMGTHVNGVIEVTSAEQPLAIADQYVKVNGSISKSYLEQSVTGNVGNIDFTIKSGTALTYDTINDEYVAGATEGDVVMTVTAVKVNLGGDDTPEWKETTKDFTVHVVNKTDVNISGLSNNETFTYDGTPKKPTGTISVNAGTVNVSDLEVKYQGTGTTSYNSAIAPTNAGTYTVTYKVPDSDTNYTGTYSVAFTIKKAQLEKVTLAKDTYEYTGSDITPTLNNVNSNIEVTGDTKAKNVSNNTITAKIKDKTNYEWKDGLNGDLTINWSITQATPNYTVPTGLTSVKGKILADVVLPTGFTWNSPATILTAGTNTYTATYTPEDTANYKTIMDIDIEVNVKNAFDVITSVPGGNGTITPSKIGVIEGSKVKITFTPKTGYMIDKVLVNGIEKTVIGNEIEITVDEEKTVEVIYKKIPFTITVEEVTGVTVDPDGIVTVNYGDNKDFTITANTGYKLVKVLVNDEEKALEGNTLKLKNIMSNMKIKVVVEKIEYKVIEGADQTYTIDQSTEARFRINADYSLFDKKVYVDDILVDGANYTSESGSTIITFSKEYIDTLAIGQHTLKVAFTDGGEAKTTFTIARQFEENNNNENVSLNAENKKEMKDDGSNPKTGDNVMLYIAIVSMSIIGLGATTVAVKKNKTN